MLSQAAISLILASPACTSALAPDRSDIQYNYHNVLFSSLSPLFRYTPLEAWTFQGGHAIATTPGANVSLEIFTDKLYLWGNQSGSELDITPWIPRIYPNAPAPNYQYGEQSLPGDMPLIIDYGVGFFGPPLQARQISFEVPEPDDAGISQGAFISVKEAQMLVVVPSGQDPTRQIPADNAHAHAAVSADHTPNKFFHDIDNHWQVQHLSYPWSTYTTVPLPGGPWEWQTPKQAWVHNSVLATTTRDAPLRFSIPANTTIAHIYGSVGSQLGKFEVRLLPRQGERTPIDVADQKLLRRVDSYRPVNVSSELLTIVWLDPRARYDAEIVLTDKLPGRGVHIHGIAFKTYVKDPEALPVDWRADYNNKHAHRDPKWYRNATPVGITILAVSAILLGLWWFLKKRRGVETITERTRLLSHEEVSVSR